MADPLDRLSSLSAPRPLSAALRARLEDQLLGADARPLTEHLDASLTDALRDPVGELLAGLDGPRPLQARTRAWAEQRLVRAPRRRLVTLGRSAAALAAAAAAAGLLVLVLPHGSGAPNSASRPAASPSGQVGSGTADAGGAGLPAGTTGGGAPVAAPGQAFGPASPPVPASGGMAGAGVQVSPAPSSRAAQPTSPTPRPTARRAPTVDTLSPSSGPAGTWVTLSGHDLTPTSRVTFGDAPATRVEQVSTTQVRALAPPHVPGPVDVVLTTAAGSSAPQRYLYLPA